MRHLFSFVLFLLVTQFSYAQNVACANQSSKKVFLTANLKNAADGQVYLDSIKILSSDASTALAKGSLASDVDYQDYKTYRFRSKPKSLHIVDPSESGGIFGGIFSSKPTGSNDYIGEGRVWVSQDQSAEFNIENRVVFSFDYQNAIKKKSFKLHAWHDIDEYYVPMDNKLICNFK